MQTSKILLSLSLVLLIGCGKKLPDTIDNFAIADGTYHQVPVESVDELPDLPGETKDNLIAVVTVPTLTVDSKTGEVKEAKVVVQIHKQKKSLRARLLPKKDEPKTPVSVASTAPGTHAYYEESWPWWYWFIGIVIVLGITAFVINKYTSWLTTPLSWIKSLWR